MAASNNNDDNDKKQCRQCVELLKRVLSSSASRPRALLEAMGSTSRTTASSLNSASSCDFTPTANGVVVSFHKEAATAVSNATQTAAAAAPHKQPVSRRLSVPQPLALSSTSSSDHHQRSPTRTTPPLKIECRPCGTHGPEGGARAFVMGPTPLSIVLCSNRLHHLKDDNNEHGNSSGTNEMAQVLTHELVHVYDVKKLQLDLQQCVSLAYSEIRAAREAECNDLFRAPASSRSSSWRTRATTGTTSNEIMAQQSKCVRTKALEATQNLFPRQAATCISQAYAQGAMTDLRPFFDEHAHDNTQSSFPGNNNNSSSSMHGASQH